MLCEDGEPHPVDHEQVCFNVERNAEDVTDVYCEAYNISGQAYMAEDGHCCLPTEIQDFYFLETCEHNLEYYCVDALGNKGPVDEEKFKVEDTSFNITLNEKWNLISVPVQLLDDSIDEVFAQCEAEVISVWSYDAVAKNWSVYTPDGDPMDDNLHTMVPGEGYWVLADEPCTLVIGGSLYKPGPSAPPAKEIAGDDWNLVGYYGVDGQDGYYGPMGNGKSAWCTFSSLGDDIWDFMTTSVLGYWQPTEPVWQEYGRYDRLDPGAGYWMFATQDGKYVRPTMCEEEPLPLVR
jgi:hypothetical protein